jgi:hypothetical protein
MFAEEAVFAGVQSTGFTICCMLHSRKLQGNLRWVYSKFEWGVKISVTLQTSLQVSDFTQSLFNSCQQNFHILCFLLESLKTVSQ